MRACCLEACLLQRILQLSPLCRLLLSVVVYGSQGRLNSQRLQSIKNLLRDGTISPQTTE
jgi:hypothetical protein